MNIKTRVFAALSVAIFFSALSVAQTSAGIENWLTANSVDDSMKGWKPVCILPSCNPGGSGIPTRTSQTIGHSKPSKDGNAMKVSITGPQYSNALWTYIAAHEDVATSISMSVNVYLTNKASVAGSFEYDLFEFSKSTGIEFMWGSQCNQVNRLWQVFDQLHGHWINTAVRCSLTPNTWHQVRWDVHHVAGDTNRCSGKPCMYYDTLTVDGVPYPVNLKYPAGPLPGGWSRAVGFQVQIDIGTTGQPVTIDEYLDLADFSAI